MIGSNSNNAAAPNVPPAANTVAPNVLVPPAANTAAENELLTPVANIMALEINAAAGIPHNEAVPP
jgi:hypothetical protein